jgi:hypothetical protein
MEEKDVRIGSLMQLSGMFTLGACSKNPVVCDGQMRWCRHVSAKKHGAGLNTHSILASVARKWNLGIDMLLFIPQPVPNVIAQSRYSLCSPCRTASK